jgi:hypothetical protein
MLFYTRRKTKFWWIIEMVMMIIIPDLNCLILVSTASSSTTSFFEFTTFRTNFWSCCTMTSTRWSTWNNNKNLIESEKKVKSINIPKYRLAFRAFRGPCNKTVFLPFGDRSANWSNVKISPPAPRILARTRSVRCKAQTVNLGTS